MARHQSVKSWCLLRTTMQVAAFLIFANNLVAQTLQIDGRYYAESSRVRLEAEINRNNILIRSFYFFTTGGERAFINSCSAEGAGFGNRISINGPGIISGYCNAPFVHGQFSGAQNRIEVTGLFPNIKFVGGMDWGNETVTLMREENRMSYEEEKRTGKITTTYDFLDQIQKKTEELHSVTKELTKDEGASAKQKANAANPPSSLSLATTTIELERLTSEFEAERKKRQELEGQLAAESKARERLALDAKEREQLLAAANERERQLAEAKDRERQQTPQPERPQAVLRNERRLALIIGNSSYKVSPLDNPANDATDIAESLKKFGFQTTLVRNATLGQMREATRRFADQLPSADVALIYFAGHGIESNRKNFMIPVNADLKFEYELADQGYDAGIWLEMLESIKSNNADRVNIVILDACRNNSLIGSRNLGRGLGKMDAPSGTFLAYSTAPGKVAADGGRGERNSPFTKHLLRAMQQPNQPIEEVFKEVRRNVGKETNGAQVPWESTSLTGFFAFRQMR